MATKCTVDGSLSALSPMRTFGGSTATNMLATTSSQAHRIRSHTLISHSFAGRRKRTMNRAYRLVIPLLAFVLISSTAAPAFSQQALTVKLISVTSPARHGYDATIVVAT